MEKFIAWALTTLVTAFLGSYLGAYLKKKGENLATHEDIDKLKDQVRVVTTTTKEIEAKISGEVWDRQRRWELKRDVLIQMMKLMGPLPRLLSDYGGAVLTQPAIAGQEWLEWRAKAQEALGAALSDFDSQVYIVGMLCGIAAERALRDLSLHVRNAGIQLGKGELDESGFSQVRWGTSSKVRTAMGLIRKELNIEDDQNTSPASALTGQAG